MGRRVRVSIEVYEQLSRDAEQKGISVNDLANQLLEKAMV
jgi:predicted HicB family RNase H-like nuclease